MELHNKFQIYKTMPTKARIFKDLKVGQIVEISTPIHSDRHGSEHTLYAFTVKINGEQTLMSTLEKEINRGFDFVEVKE